MRVREEGEEIMADIALLYAEQYKKMNSAKQDNNALVPAVDGQSLLAGIARRAAQAINRGMEKFPVMGADGPVDPKGLFAFAIVEGCFSS